MFGTQKTSINDGKGTSNITSRHVETKVCFVCENNKHIRVEGEEKNSSRSNKKDPDFYYVDIK